MALTPATRLGPFVILEAIGAGGMGEVYRARDTRLNRDVAIKVLPAAFIENGERLQRFTLEAQLLAQLHHPNIATVFGLEESSGEQALVMEFIDGQDLSARIADGPIPLEEALPIAKQIAEALEAAHEHGIVHRDLKPANVKISPDGIVKVLDFGLAKALDPTGLAGVGNSPTFTARATQHGTILGSAAYMAPEQARGKAVDRRADIWAFGVVLFEMLAGRRTFAGDATSDVLAAVLLQEIDWRALPAGTPPRLRWLLERCLERNPRQRLRDIGEARVALDELAQGASHKADARVPPAGVMSAVRARAGRPLTVVSAVALLALGFALGRSAGWPSGPDPAAFAAAPVAFERLTYQAGHFVNARFAPDRQTVFLSAAWRGAREVFQVQPQARELPVGFPNAELLSVSRSGELALLLPRVETGNPYVNYGTLAVVAASGGTPRELAENVSGADWAPDGASLAALRVVGSRQRLEYPLGTTLYESASRIFAPRVSPAGDSVAFFELDASGLWSVVLVDRSGQRQILSKDWADWWNLVWSPDGREILVCRRTRRYGFEPLRSRPEQQAEDPVVCRGHAGPPRRADYFGSTHRARDVGEPRARPNTSGTCGARSLLAGRIGRGGSIDRRKEGAAPRHVRAGSRPHRRLSPPHGRLLARPSRLRAAARALPGRELGAGHPRGHRRRDAHRSRQRTDDRNRLSHGHRGAMAAGR